MANNDRLNGILSDEVVQYISDRHRVAPQDLIDSIKSEDDRLLGRVVIDDNEYRIIHDLLSMYNINKV